MSDEQAKFVLENYKTMKYKDIAAKLGFTEKQIRSWVSNHAEKKIRVFNSRYFQNIDTPTKAYWLGFIYADGWVSINEKRRTYELGIELCASDVQQLLDLNNELGGVHLISRKHKECVIYNNKVTSITDIVKLRIYSKPLVQDLIDAGILENKTLKSGFPIVEDSLFMDFLRGYIDGDGCIYVKENKPSGSQVHITSAHNEILNYIRDKLAEVGIPSYVYSETDKKYRIYINGKYALKLLDMIYYDDNSQKLKRKYQKYLTLKAFLSGDRQVIKRAKTGNAKSLDMPIPC